MSTYCIGWCVYVCLSLLDGLIVMGFRCLDDDQMTMKTYCLKTEATNFKNKIEKFTVR